jgi:hypothetical protein
MNVYDLLHEYRPPTVVLTASGAGIEPIGGDAAREFLEQRCEITIGHGMAGAAWGSLLTAPP